MEVFRKYPETTPVEERKGSPACVVSHPDAGGPCQREAIGEVWSLPFCEMHGREAELAAKAEIEVTVGRELQVLADTEFERFDTNHYVLEVLKAAKAPYEVDRSIHEAAMLRAYPPDELEANTDADTRTFDYGRDYATGEAGDGPVDWWADACYLLHRFMREAAGRGVLTDELEYLRERATAQLVLAERDCERRYAEPRRAAIAEREAAKQA
jgi:hypothetical protein